MERHDELQVKIRGASLGPRRSFVVGASRDALYQLVYHRDNTDKGRLVWNQPGKVDS